MKAGNVHKFNCTSCGAGLDALGGGRVRTHVGPCCGAELDAQDDYKVLRQFRDMERPRTPFQLGMTGTFWGVEFTVIGTMAWSEYHDGRSWHWVDHQLYSPTHGYAWLTVENGHVTFARKSRSMSRPASISDSAIENAENRPSVRFRDKTFVYYGSGRASPNFIEGEFNFRPDMDDSIRYVSLMGGEEMLDIVESRTEREYEISVLPDQAALFESFGIAPRDRPRAIGTHALDALDRSPLQLFTRNLFLLGAVLAVFVAIVMTYLGSEIAKSQTARAGSEIELPFTVTNGRVLTEIELWADVHNSWAWFEAELTDDEDETVAAFEDGVQFYKGSDWSEGSQRRRVRMYLEPGEYTLYLSLTEAEVDWSGGRKARNFRATVREGVANAWWVWGAAVLLALLAFIFLGERFLRHHARWSGSDWSDD